MHHVKLSFPLFPEPDGSLIIAQLKRHEGLRLAAYRDSLGILTIGYGHNCESSPLPGVILPGDSITLDEAEKVFREDLIKSAAALHLALPWLRTLVPARQAVLINMVFNMGLGNQMAGSGVMGFRRMLKAAKEGDYALASKEMLNSRWASQVGPRARELACQMESGLWPDAENTARPQTGDAA